MQSQKDSGRRQTKISKKDTKRQNREPDDAKEFEIEDEAEDHENTGDKKRLRVSRACDQCRKRKDKCDGQQPVCLPCSNGNRVCTYNMSTKKRGLPTGYVRSIEILLGLVFSRIKGSEALVSTLLSTENNTSNPEALPIATEGGIQRAESLADVWRRSVVAKQIELLLPTPESQEDEDGFSQRLNEKLALASCLVATQDPTSEDTSKTLNSNIIPPDEVTNPPPIPLNMETELDASIHPMKDPLNLPSNWLQLLDLYFSTTHSWFPMCQKQDLLRPAYMLASSDHDGSDTLPAGDRAFLWAVLAFAEHQYERLDLRPPNHTLHVKYSSEELISAARRLVSISCHAFEPGHVRALLVLGLLEMGRGCWTHAWVIIGQALYIATGLGIIAPTTRGSAEDVSTIDEGQKRLARGCFVLDTLISACLGRRPYLKSADLRFVGSLQVDSIEEWEAWQPIDLLKDDQDQIKSRRPTPGWISSIFNQFVELVTLLNDLISSSDASPKDIVWIISKGLDTWGQQLPPHLQSFKSINGVTKEKKSPQLLNLCLTFVFVSSLLKDIGEGVILATSQDLFVAQDSSMDQLFGVITEHVQKFGPLWMPLVLLENFQRKLNSILQHDASMISPQTTSFRAQNDNQDQVATIPSSVTTASGPLVEQTQGQLAYIASFDLGMGLQSSKTSIRTTESTIQQDQASNQNQQLGSFDSRFRTGDDIDFSTLGGPLTGGIDADFLFDSLASLDPVDWTANQPEFMQHLGFTGEFVQSDYQSFFNT